MFEDEYPENALERQDEALAAINALIDNYMDSHDGRMYVFEFGLWIYVLLWRMRQSFNFQQLVGYMSDLMRLTERGIQAAKDEHGEDFIIAEDWQDVEGGREMIDEIYEASRAGTVTVPDEWTT